MAPQGLTPFRSHLLSFHLLLVAHQITKVRTLMIHLLLQSPTSEHYYIGDQAFNTEPLRDVSYQTITQKQTDILIYYM
jgi:hypothetical protein